MLCSIYKGLKKTGSYLYIKNRDDFSAIPESLLTIMGKLEFVMLLDLKSSTRLVQANITDVLNELELNGFYLQLADPEIVFDLKSKKIQ